MGFASAALSLYRPEWDAYENVAVVGPPEARSKLLGHVEPRLHREREWSEWEGPPGVFFLRAETGYWRSMIDQVHVPSIPSSHDRGEWDSHDALYVFFNDHDGTHLGALSLDEPVSGRRPDKDDLRLIAAICAHVEHALASARATRHAEAVEQRRSVLIAASAAFSATRTESDLLATLGDVVAQLGFERLTVYEPTSGGDLELVYARGWQPEKLQPGVLARATADAILATEPEDGCRLIAAQQLFGPSSGTDQPRSARNGRGPLAWADHCLVVCTHDHIDALTMFAVVEDPSDRLIPSRHGRQVLRVLFDHAESARGGLRQRALLEHRADHDALTGLRNRNGLDQLLGASGRLAVLLCDIDHFKDINDRYGHDAGDRVLQRFGALIRQVARDGDIPIRLGGEEFCLLIPNGDEDGAFALAERLRMAASTAMGT